MTSPASFSLQWRRYCLYTLGAPGSSGLLHQIGQLRYIVIAEQAPSSGQYDKWIWGQCCGPARRNRAQNAAVVVEVNSILAPVVAIGDQLETLALQRMM